VRLLVLGLVVLAATLVLLHWAERSRTEREMYEVYSAYLADGLTKDSHDWGVDGPVLVVIQRQTATSPWLRWRWLQVIHVLIVRTQWSDSIKSIRLTTQLSYMAANLFPTRLQPRFSLPSRARFVLAKDRDVSLYGDESGEFDRRFPGNYGYVALSAVGFNRDFTEAIFYVDHFCGLCGGGRYVVMEKKDGAWLIKQEQYRWISRSDLDDTDFLGCPKSSKIVC
jgi:hypothetical protein